jgi:hypothetical protein
MRFTWRFFVDGGKWYWERCAVGEPVPQRSPTPYRSYEDALAGAQHSGYSFTPSQTAGPRATSLRHK